MKVERLILNNMIDAHLIDSYGYCAVLSLTYNEVYNYLIEDLGYEEERVNDMLSHNPDYYKEEAQEYIANKYRNAYVELFHQARIDEAEHEQQLVNKQSFNHTENNF